MGDRLPADGTASRDVAEPTVAPRDSEPTVAPRDSEPTVAPRDSEPTVAPRDSTPGDTAPDDPPPAVPLLVPRGPVIGPITDRAEFADWIRQLNSGPDEPVAIDAERASGFRYSARAYLIQVRRADVGTALVDPTAFGNLAALDPALSRSEWVLHAASQDLACLAELGLRPRRLFDTELAGRLAGMPRVGLGPLVEHVLGLHLRKGHGAADWSTRPLPHDWLVYAALDVEVLVELRDAMERTLRRQAKWEWAQQEFEAIANAPPPAPRAEPWRRTSGVHKISDPRALSLVRALWEARDAVARERDRAPHRVLPDTAIINAAIARPATVRELTALPVFSGRMQRRLADRWLAAIRAARALPVEQLPTVRLAGDGPPPPAKWSGKDPRAAARLQDVKAALAELSDKTGTPVENLVAPDAVRRILWSPPDDDVAGALRGRRARPWQIELVAPILTAAIAAHPPAEH